MIPRLKAVRDVLPLVFVIGDKNRGKLSSEADLRAAGLCANELTFDSLSFENSGDVMFVPNTGHGQL
jgi:hypothetical protein